MKAFFLALTFALAGTTSAQVFNSSFPTDGALVGQEGFLQNAAVATNPIQVTGGRVVLASAGGQDAYVNFASLIPGTDATSAFYGLTINVTSATATGDYFAHFTSGTTNPTNFTGRLAVQATAGGFFLGFSFTTAGGTTYGTTPLSLNTDYRVVLQYNFVAGALNDTGAVYVAQNPGDLSQASPYLTAAFSGATAETTSLTGFQFRQGGAATAAGLAADNLVVAGDFATAASIPEPSAVILGLTGLAGLMALRRRRN